MSTDAEKLAQIAALCDDAEHNATRWHDPLPVPEWVARVRAVLAEPGPAVPSHMDLVGALTRVVAKAIPNGEDKDGFITGYVMGTGAIHNAMKVLQDHGVTARPGGFVVRVRPEAEPHGIDRDVLLELLSDETGWEWEGEQNEPAPIFGCDTRVPSSQQALEAFADRILALVHPVEPVAFTRDRVRTELLASLPADPKWVAWVDGVLDRLEATS